MLSGFSINGQAILTTPASGLLSGRVGRKNGNGYRLTGDRGGKSSRMKAIKRRSPSSRAYWRRLGKEHGWTLSDIKKMFSNEILDFLYLDDVVATPSIRIQDLESEAVEKVG